MVDMQHSYWNPALPVAERVQDLLSRMTLEEKVAQLSSIWVYEVMDDMRFSAAKAKATLKEGIGQITRVGGASNVSPEESAVLANAIQRFLREETRLGIPAMVHEEACSGYMARGATIFPQAIGVASTWDPALVEAMAQVIARQMRSVGAHQALAPLLDVAHDARWGRVEETFGEDPYLVAQMGMHFVRGLQDSPSRVLATGKHFVGYGASEGGMNWAPAHLGPRELRDLYLWPFEAAVKSAHLASIMPAYHELDGTPCHASRQLLTALLRDEWGFDGLVVSDYFAVAMLQEYHHVAENRREAATLAVNAGVDIELPSRDAYGQPLLDAVKEGRVAEDAINRAVARVLRIKFELGLFENPYVSVDDVPAQFDRADDRALSLRLAQESFVLLKNRNDLLPLARNLRRLAIVGPNAVSARNLFGDYSFMCHIESLLEMRDQGNVFETPLPEGMKAGEVFQNVDTVAQAFKDALPHTECVVVEGVGIRTGQVDDAEFRRAVAAAREADVALVVVGDKSGLTLDATSGESRDRSSLKLPGAQEALVQAVAATGTPVVLVLVAGRPVDLTALEPVVDAILVAWLPGTEGAKALTQVMLGDVSPSGKLPMAFPRSVGQVPVFYNHKPSGGRSHWHGDYVDEPATPLYAFGYGLSYTRFEYRDLEVSWDDAHDEVVVRFFVKNAGPRAGDEIAQVYVHDAVASVTRPVKELKAFARVSLEPGAERAVTARIPIAALAFYDLERQWVAEAGRWEILVGRSSDDICLTAEWVLPETRRFSEPAFSSPVVVS
ncbi:MAG: glycoside hydrolase family 3 C-terminal domain-containing protein [Firmicutes bacterium]|nr:glycoside hydrolase family 3 C-terminal domain-containing protein [Bacillota bacterium]